MNIATAAALASTLVLPPRLVGRDTKVEATGPSSASQRPGASRALQALRRHAAVLTKPFLAAADVEDLDLALAEALDDEALFQQLAVFDKDFSVFVAANTVQATDREALAALVGPRVADWISSPSPLDKAYDKAFDQARAEILAGFERKHVFLISLPPAQAALWPGRVMSLVLDVWKSKFAGATLLYAILADKRIRGWRAERLMETIAKGKHAGLLLLASAGVHVPAELAPAAERLDLDGLVAQAHRIQSKVDNAPSFDLADPDASRIFS